jgi:ketosteroid isomerase-like protein
MNLEAERKRLLQRDAEWASITSEGEDVERIISFWTDDARVYPPGQPVIVGKAALRSYVRAALGLPGFHITWTSSDATVSPDGKLGYMLSRNAVTLPASDGTLVTLPGRAVTIWRREADGEWRCAVDIWNDEPQGGGSAG